MIDGAMGRKTGVHGDSSKLNLSDNSFPSTAGWAQGGSNEGGWVWFDDHSEMVEVGRAGASSLTQVTLGGNPRLLGHDVTCFHPLQP